MSEQFDVFLCHNSQDKPEVKKIARQLQDEGLKPWLDEWELRPGLSWQELLEEQIEEIKAAAVFVGSSGFGPWQEREMRAFLSEFVNRHCPVIPVLLETAPDRPSLPIFLKAMTWVDFRQSEPNPMERLIWGITGVKPILIKRLDKEETPLSDVIQPVTSPLTEIQRRHLEQQLKEQQKEYNHSNEEIEFLSDAEKREDLRPKELWRLKQQIAQAKRKRDDAAQQIEELEKKLNW